jgi:hypothetical protein
MIRHHPTHWIAVAVVLVVALLTLREAHGQSTNAAAVFEGRPALAGAQAGLGAQAGPPQGGIGLQGSDGAELNLRPPRAVREARQDNMPQGEPAGAAEVIATLDEERLLPPKVEPDLTPAQARTQARQAR